MGGCLTLPTVSASRLAAAAGGTSSTALMHGEETDTGRWESALLLDRILASGTRALTRAASRRRGVCWPHGTLWRVDGGCRAVSPGNRHAVHASGYSQPARRRAGDRVRRLNL